MTSPNIAALPLASITVSGLNDRKAFRDDELQKLAASIAADGLAQPIVVRPVKGGYELVVGERRLRAHQRLGLATIAAVIRVMTDDQASRIMLAENVHRADLNQVEEAHAFASRMERFGLTDQEVAVWANVHVIRVRNRLALLTLRDDVQALVASGQLPAFFAICMSGLDGNRQTIALARYRDAKRQLPLPEFRLICGQLLEEQNQEALFPAGPDDFQLQPTPPPGPEDDGTGVTFPTDPALPQMLGARTVRNALTNYHDLLAASDDPHQQAAALVVATIMKGLVRSRLCGGLTRKKP